MGYMVNLVLKGKPAVVVGGGAVAARKIEDLLAAGAMVTVISARASARIKPLAQKGLISAHWRAYRSSDLDGACLAIAATDDESVNARVAREARFRNVLVNVVDRPALCTFTLPAVVRRDKLSIAVATGGLCPSLAGVLRTEIRERYGPEYGKLVTVFGALRKRMMALGWKGERIKEAVSQMYRDGIIELISARDRERLEGFFKAHLGSEFPLPPGTTIGAPRQMKR